MEELYGVLIAIVLLAAASILVARDANSRGMKGVIWGVFTFLFLALTLPVYFVVRKAKLGESARPKQDGTNYSIRQWISDSQSFSNFGIVDLVILLLTVVIFGFWIVDYFQSGYHRLYDQWWAGFWRLAVIGTVLMVLGWPYKKQEMAGESFKLVKSHLVVLSLILIGFILKSAYAYLTISDIPREISGSWYNYQNGEIAKSVVITGPKKKLFGRDFTDLSYYKSADTPEIDREIIWFTGDRIDLESSRMTHTDYSTPTDTFSVDFSEVKNRKIEISGTGAYQDATGVYERRRR